MTETSQEFNQKRIRTRFAPSPTGFLHIGSARTALFAYLLARKHSGDFILRIEDTDQGREVDGAVEGLTVTLHNLNLTYDEGVFMQAGKPVSRGDHGPYLQSERLEIYHKYADQLLEQGSAYRCFCDEQRLAEVRKEQEALKRPTQYDRRCRTLTPEQVKENLEKDLPSVIRQAIPLDGQTTIDDLVFGKIVIENKNLDDQVLVKSDGFPTYHLAVVVDDHLMEITHVIRGDEWIPSTPKHILLYQALGWEPTAFAHMPLILNKDHSKLAKRQGDVAVEDFLAKGYLPEALLNYVALLGWNPKTEQEIFSLEELVQQFDIAKVNKSGAVFDLDRLDWVNGQYIRKMPAGELIEKILPYLGTKTDSRKFIEAIVEAEKSRLKKLSDISDRTSYYFARPAPDPAMLVWKKSTPAETKKNLESLHGYLAELDESSFTSETLLEQAAKLFIEQNSLDNGSVLWPMRVALSGMEASPGPFQLAHVLYVGYGKQEILDRIHKGIDALS